MIVQVDEYDDRRSIKNSEIEAIPFTWTPELARLANSRFRVHPFLGPLEHTEPENPFPRYIYRPGVTLPDPADTRACLKWVGLSDEKITQVEQKFNELYPDFQRPSCGYDEKFDSTGRNSIKFPVVDKMMNVFYRMLDHTTSDHEYTHEGYIKKAIQPGLRPEFAVFCGLHKDDPRSIEDPYLFELDWFDTSATSIVIEVIECSWIRLKNFLVSKLVHEGKAWIDGASEWLVHEEEDIDQAKARVSNLDREQLREQAQKRAKEENAKREEEYHRQLDLEMAEAEAEYRAPRGEDSSAGFAESAPN